MFLQQSNQAVQQQWLSEEQQNQALQAQHQQALQLQQSNVIQDDASSFQPNRKRGFATESDDNLGHKKRNMRADLPVQGVFGGYAEVMPDTPGSIISLSADQEADQGSYFDQQPYYTSSSMLNTGSQGPTYLGTGSGNGASAPTTPAGSRHAPSSSLSSSFSMPNSNQPGLWSQGSHSSPPTPHLTTTPAIGAANMFAAAVLDPQQQQNVQYQNMLQQNQLQEAQQQEQQSLQLSQKLEIEQLQRQQFEQQSKVHAMARISADQQMLQHAPPPHMQATTPVHHDHNDPATWGYDQTSATGGQFVGYLGGQGRGYTPAAIGGVAALAAVSAMAASRHPQGAGRGAGSSAMDMDF
ncbi:hypothetical protein BGZ70_002584 [Mortierella alpina]|uniref:Uncharacterized protein n=1 Tax=Mortierella alpina TaxID=64518 RepID=A0A9P6JDE3_MORAP|nr:hypothetical protein BGZ70_002584 [Mortierella alpina]